MAEQTVRPDAIPINSSDPDKTSISDPALPTHETRSVLPSPAGLVPWMGVSGVMQVVPLGRDHRSAEEFGVVNSPHDRPRQMGSTGTEKNVCGSSAVHCEV